MTGQLFILVCVGVLLLPTLGALVARLMGARYGQRSEQAVGMLGFASALVCALVVGFVDTDRLDLGSFAVFVPRSGPVIDSDAFTLRREPQVVGAAGGALETPESSAEVVAAVPPMLPPTDATFVPAPMPPTRTIEPTLEPTLEPTTEPVPEATLEPTVEPTLEPTPELTVEPTVEATLEPTVEPTPEPALEPTVEALPPSPSEPTAVPPTVVPPTTIARGNATTAYTVRSGDTLRGIADRFDITVNALLSFNGLTPEEGDSLRIGQRLYIPRAPAAPVATRTPQRTVQAYVVKKGDTLRSIAATFNITVDTLLQYNGLTGSEGDSLSIGQRLYIPAR